MNRRDAVLALVVLGAVPFAAAAQQPAKIPRIGFLSGVSPSVLSARVEAFRQGLRDLGYVEAKSVVIEYRWAEGKYDREPDLAVELVHLKVDIIVTAGQTSTRAAKKATSTIPIVMASDSDPVGNGFATSLARPGGNITGLSTLGQELSGKQLAILKEIVPKISRVAVLGTSTVPGNPQALKETELAAGALQVTLQYIDVPSPKDIETAFRAASKGRADAVIVLASPVLLSRRAQIVDLARKNRLPVIYHQQDFAEDGGLITYGVNINDLYRRAATYVDKILKGRTPADLPVEQPTKFDLVINMKTAKALGITIPQSILVRADRVIE